MQSLRALIQERKKQMKALILAHYYQPADIQKIADFVGDSLELSRKAQQADVETIVFCGVYFMAESAKILSPKKRVLIPDSSAGCPMADGISPEDVRRLRQQFPQAAVVTYINSSAAVKAESDICCTSANARAVVASLPEHEIIFIPDRNLGQYVAQTSDKIFHFFDGCCPIHQQFTREQVLRAGKRHPGVPILVHPECPPEVTRLADFIGSTSRIIEYAAASPESSFIIGTEPGILFPLRQACPGKTFYLLSSRAICPDMKKITPKMVLDCLTTGQHAVELDDDILIRATGSLERMMSVHA